MPSTYLHFLYLVRVHTLFLYCKINTTHTNSKNMVLLELIPGFKITKKNQINMVPTDFTFNNLVAMNIFFKKNY